MLTITRKLVADGAASRRMNAFLDGLDDDLVELALIELTDTIVAKVEECTEIVFARVSLPRFRYPFARPRRDDGADVM